MLRRKKKDQGSPDSAGAEAAPDVSADAGAPGEEPGSEAAARAHDGSRPGDAAIAMAEEPPAPPSPPPFDADSSDADSSDVASSDAPAESRVRPPSPPPPDGDFVERLPVSFYFEGVVKPERVPSREELERQAEADFRAAIAPSLEALRELVPDASSPEEAMRVLAERQGEALVDEEGANLSSRDIYRNETSVYYRIRTHFDKPSRRVGFGREWRPPAGLASQQRELPSGRRSSR